jgi:negative regulator of flagellin synthesis FlgM
MKINDVNRVGSVNPYRKQQAAGNAMQVGKKSAKDEVQFSEEALKLLESQETAAVDPARAAKLSELKEAVAGGTYKVDAQKVAEKMLEHFGRQDGPRQS